MSLSIYVSGAQRLSAVGDITWSSSHRVPDHYIVWKMLSSSTTKTADIYCTELRGGFQPEAEGIRHLQHVQKARQ